MDYPWGPDQPDEFGAGVSSPDVLTARLGPKFGAAAAEGARQISTVAVSNGVSNSFK